MIYYQQSLHALPVQPTASIDQEQVFTTKTKRQKASAKE